MTGSKTLKDTLIKGYIVEDDRAMINVGIKYRAGPHVGSASGKVKEKPMTL